MRKNMMRRNLLRSIKNSIARYLAIVAIIALGAGMFVGLRTTKSDMIATGQQYMDEQNMFDLRLLNTYGWSLEDVQKVAALNGVESAEGVFSMDAIVRYEGVETESVYKLYSIPKTVNKLYLHGGRMPAAPNECLADGFHVGDEILGRQITVLDSNEESVLDGLTEHTFTVVGYVSTPLYMDMSRGNTALGNGVISAYLYLPEETFDLDYYSDIMITLPGENEIYSDSYNRLMEEKADEIKLAITPIADNRYQTVLQDAKDAYEDGLKEYEDGVKEYEEGKAEAEKELKEAKEKLEDAEQQIADNTKLLEDSQEFLEKGEKQLEDGKKRLAAGKVTLANAKADAYSQMADGSAELMNNYRRVNDALDQVNDGLAQIDSGLAQINSGISQLESGLSTLETVIGVTETLLDVANSSLTRAQRALDAAKQAGISGDLLAELEAAVADAEKQVADNEAQLAEQKTQYEEYSAQLVELQAQKAEVETQRIALEQTKAELNAAQKQIDRGFVELETNRTQMESKFSAAEAELQASTYQLESAEAELLRSKSELEKGLKELEDGKKELTEGWQEYFKGETEAMNELADAKQKLDDAKQELADAKETIDSMKSPDVYALDRSTNMGYMALDSNSDIVEGVSTVFPAFFLLIAALVCITTMTRMVEDERTQIGTLKALGYSNGAIIGKYLAYAGSAAVIGCGLGVVIGSVVFPLVLWNAYQIIMFLGDFFVLRINWLLCGIVVLVYTAVSMFVTWFSCRMSLREVPAELIRPKAPTVGKKIFLEYLPFWERFSFLNKVMLRNIFRYKQRLLMMLVGIGGCTALLLTGFGIRDSIGDLPTYQFTEVILYDLEVRFDHSMTEEDMLAFNEEFSDDMGGACFYHQSSMELEFDGAVKDVTFYAAPEQLGQYIDFHIGKTKLEMPGVGEALVSAGAAKRMDISVGDNIIVRDTNMQELHLRVSGVFDNNVYNYVIASPETVEAQWGSTPEIQMACVNATDGGDVHELGAAMTEFEGVMSVTVNKDVENSVGKMLEALDLVVVTIVICASLLAIIVLYNLTNINITERIREIATIKVLGFNAAETAAYVFKENLLLSLFGSVLGLGGGVLLLEFVMSKIQVDMVWMSARLLPISFVWAMVVTMLSACLVDFVLYFKLEKVNMAEALKSVE